MGFNQYQQVLKISIVVAVVVLTLLPGVYFAFKPGGDCSVSKKSYFAVVVDCGSTGMGVNVFEWVAIGSSKRDLPILLQRLHFGKVLVSFIACKLSHV